jgi:hypothetical protein
MPADAGALMPAGAGRIDSSAGATVGPAGATPVFLGALGLSRCARSFSVRSVFLGALGHRPGTLSAPARSFCTQLRLPAAIQVHEASLSALGCARNARIVR